MRRKSSSFRPHNWIYPKFSSFDSGLEQLSLERLPIVILEFIFGYLQTPDLLELCVISKYLYLPAVNCLYQKISISGDASSLQYAHAQQQNENWNRCTVIKPEKIVDLLNVVRENRKLAAIVHSISITRTKEVSLVPHLLSHLRLSEFHYGAPLKIPHSSCVTLQQLTWYVGPHLIITPNISELKLVYLIGDVYPERFEKLALEMIESNSYRNLKKLVFKYLEEPNLHSFNLFNAEKPILDTSPPWTSFFELFSHRNTQLKLTALGLDGYIGVDGVTTASLINSAVDLDKLLKLDLKTTEHSHPGRAHDQIMDTFLEAMCSHTHSLRHLSVNPTENCLTCQFNAIKQTLENLIPQQLESLHVNIEPRTGSDTQIIERTILQFQKNLKVLKLDERSAEVVFAMTAILKNLPLQQATDWQNDTFYEEQLRKVINLRVFEMEQQRPLVSKEKVESITVLKKFILKYLETKTIFQEAHRCLPQLSEYHVLDMHINMRDRGVIANGRTILFE